MLLDRAQWRKLLVLSINEYDGSIPIWRILPAKELLVLAQFISLELTQILDADGDRGNNSNVDR